MANHQRDAAKEQHWRQLIRRWQRSGQTIRDFCADAQVSEPSFYSWRRVIAQHDRDQEAASAEHGCLCAEPSAHFSSRDGHPAAGRDHRGRTRQWPRRAPGAWL